MEEQDTQPADGMPALKITSIIVGACIILAGLAGALLFIAVKDTVEEIGELQEEFENSPPPSMPSAVAVVDDIEALADFGYRKIDTVAHANAGDFVQLRFEDLGYEVEVQNFTTELCEDCRNYIATMEGEDPDSWIVVGGHYDAICYSQQIVIGIEYPGCTSEGAYDDATGTASVLELARLMMEWQSNLSEALPGIDVRPRHTWKFAVWDYEEWQGSGSPESAGYGSETFVTTLQIGRAHV